MLTNFKEMVQKAVNTKAKAGLRSSTMVWDLDAYCSKGHCLFHNTFLKVQTQGFKDSSRPKKLKPKDPKSALSRDNVLELPKKDNRKDKKKKFWSQKREHIGEQKEQTLANSVNIIDTSKKKKEEI